MTWVRVAVATLLLAALSLVPAAASFDSDPPKDVEFTYARIRYHMTTSALYEQRELPWHHDYPEGDETFPTFVKEVTNVHTARNAYQIVDIDSKDLFKYPFIYLPEPGLLDLSPGDVKNLKEYLERGGFIMIDDFRGNLKQGVEEMNERSGFLRR